MAVIEGDFEALSQKQQKQIRNSSTTQNTHLNLTTADFPSIWSPLPHVNKYPTWISYISIPSSPRDT